MLRGLRVGRILGIPILLHPSSLILVGLLTWLLGEHLGHLQPGRGEAERLVVGGVTGVLFLASVLLHELGHGALALRHRVPVRSITLFVFGGLAAMEREPEEPRAEFEIAIAGPLVSALLALGFTALARASVEGSLSAFAGDVLGRINLAVALFNLLPGFPLDGGRVLRALLWARSGDLPRATRTAAGSGRLIGWSLVGLGGAAMLGALGPGIGGLWIALVGALVLTLAGSVGRRADLDVHLRGLRAADVMAPLPGAVDAHAPLAQFLREGLGGRRWAPVEHEGELVGLVTQEDGKRIDPDAWDTTPVGRVATPAHRVVTAAPDTPLRDLLLAMGARGVDQVPVVEEGRVLGAVSREALERTLEDARQAPPGPPGRRPVL